MKRKEINFSIIREKFSSYRVENGQTLRMLKLVADVFMEDNTAPNEAKFTMKDLSYAITPPDVNRYDIKYTRGDPTEDDRIKELKFKIEYEPTNIYETNDSFILLGGFLEKVFLTNRVDASNNPKLQYVTQTYMTTIPKPTPDSLKITGTATEL